MRLGLWLSCVYLFAVFFRPQELLPELQQLPNLMDILGIVAVIATLIDVLAGARPSFREPQIWLLAFFVLWASLTVAIVASWLGGAALAFQQLSINVFVFFLCVMHGAELSRLAAMRRALLAGLLLAVGFGLRAYYLGPRHDQFVVIEGTQGAHGQVRETGPISDLVVRLTGRGNQAAETQQPSDDPGDNAEGEESSPAPSTTAGVPRLRALGSLNDPNDLAQMLVSALPLVFLAWRPRRPLTTVLFAVLPAAVTIWAIILTRSRGGLVSLAALVWLSLALWAGPRWTRRLQWLGFGALFVLLLYFFRFGGADESAQGRLEAWSAGLQMLKYSPIWGVGFGSFADVNELVAHNSFVHCYAELGLVGYFAWLGAIIVSFRSLDHIRVSESGSHGAHELVRWVTAVNLSLSAFLVGGLFLSRTYSVALFFLLGLATALGGLARKSSRTPEAYATPLPAFVAQTAGLVLVSVVLTYVMVVLGR